VSQNYKFCIITLVSKIKYEFKLSAIYYVTYLLMSAYLACATARLSTCSLAWSAVMARVWIRAGAWNYVTRIQAGML